MRAAWWKTPELMPAPIFYAHRILKVMAQARRRVPGQQHPRNPASSRSANSPGS
jgi:S-adenosylmethionine synthetase